MTVDNILTMIITHIPPDRQRPQTLTLQSGLPPVDPHLLSLILKGAIEVHGTIGDMVFRRTRHGISVMRKAKPPRRKPSRAQNANRRRFGIIAQQARLLLQDPATLAKYTRLARRAGLSLRPYVVRTLLRKDR